MKSNANSSTLGSFSEWVAVNETPCPEYPCIVQKHTEEGIENTSSRYPSAYQNDADTVAIFKPKGYVEPDEPATTYNIDDLPF